MILCEFRLSLKKKLPQEVLRARNKKHIKIGHWKISMFVCLFNIRTSKHILSALETKFWMQKNKMHIFEPWFVTRKTGLFQRTQGAKTSMIRFTPHLRTHLANKKTEAAAQNIDSDWQLIFQVIHLVIRWESLFSLSP